MMHLGLAFILSIVVLTAFTPKERSASDSLQGKLEQGGSIQNMQEISISKELWGMAKGHKVYLYTLKNNYGMTVKVSNWGGYIQSILVPDRKGTIADVLIGYDSWQEYYTDCCYSGPIVGRFGNRIGKGQFEINGKRYQLTTNNGGANNDTNQLHGGLKGLHKRVWQGKVIDNKIELFYLSADGEEGYPGNLSIKVTYSLDQNNGLKIAYEASTDKKTPVNLTSHTYFNLSGNMARDIEGHELKIAAETITPVDDLLIPTGDYMPVANTPFDFNQPKAIGEQIRVKNCIKLSQFIVFQFVKCTKIRLYLR